MCHVMTATHTRAIVYLQISYAFTDKKPIPLLLHISVCIIVY